MHKNIGPALKSATSLFHVKKELVELFKVTRKQAGVGIIRIGYVAGIITSEGPEYFEANRKRLADYVKKLRKIHKFPMFSAVDIFTSEVYERLEEWKLPFVEREVKARSFWRKILKSGHVTDVFMTPCPVGINQKEQLTNTKQPRKSASKSITLKRKPELAFFMWASLSFRIRS